jgi:YihY family inner membrane protein
LIRWKKLITVLHRCGRITGTFFRSLYFGWNRDNVFFSAAAIAFNVLVTMIPLSVLIFQLSAVAVTGDLSIREEFANWLVGLNPFVPQSIISDMEHAVLDGSSTIGIIGFVTLLWMVSRLFGTIRTALDKVFRAPGRHIVWGKLFDFLLAILVAVCFTLAAVFTIATKLAAGSPAGEFLTSQPNVGQVLSGFLARILSGTFTFLVFFLLYWAGPNRSMSKVVCFLTAALAMVLSSLGTSAYMWTVSAPDWGIVYGSFIGIMATVFWLYWLCVIFLGSAEVSSVVLRMRAISKQKT